MAKSNIDVFLKLVGQRKFDAQVRASGKELEEMGLRGAAGIARIANQGEKLKTLGSSLTRNVTLPLLGIAAYGVKTAVTFDKSMAQFQVATGLGSKGMERMRGLALEMGAKTIFSANDSAQAMLELAKSGITPAQIKAGSLASTMSLAATEGLDLAKTAEINSAAMNTFGIAANKSQMITDALAGGANASSASVEGLALSLQQGGQSASMYGVNINEAVGTLAAFAQNGLQGTDAGTSFKTFLARLNPVTKKQRELMDELNLSFFNQRGQFIGLEGVAKRLRTTLAGLTQQERGQILQVLFGSDAQRAANIVYKEGESGLRHYIAATEQRGAAEEMANAQMKGLPGAIERMKGSLETAALVFGEAITPAVNSAAGAVESLANGFSALPKSTQTIIAVGAGVAAMAGPTLWFAGALANGMGRALIATRGLAGWLQKVGSLGAPTTAAQSGLEASSAGGVATKSGALSARLVARGFAGSLGAALGIYDISNIVVASTKGEWEKAGIETGGMVAGAAAGALAGSFIPGVGTVLGGVLGAGIGGIGGQLLAGLLDSGSKLAPIQQKLARDARNVAKYFGDQKEAGTNLARSSRRVKDMQERLATSSHNLRTAEHRLNTVKHNSSASSVRIAEAEWGVARSMHGHERAIHRLRQAERLHGQQLQWFKQISRTAVLEERNQINNLKRKRESIIQLFRDEKNSGASQTRLTEIAKRGQNTVKELSGAQKDYKGTLQEATQKAGPKFAHFLEHGTSWAINFGGALKAANARLRTTTELTNGLNEIEPFAVPDLGNLGSGVTGLPAGPERPPGPTLGPPAPSHHRGKSAPKQGRGKLFGTTSIPRLTLEGSRVIELHSHHDITVVSEIDGKPVAEAVARQSSKAANRQ